MELTIYRKEIMEGFTRGVLRINGEYFCDTLEDPFREKKIKGETSIWTGSYKVGFREQLTNLTKRYIKRFPEFFSRHIEIKNVKDFTGIYFHIGNYVKDTEGCVLLGYNTFISEPEGLLIADSTMAYKDFYIRVSAAILRGEEVTLKIVNVKNI